MLSQRLQLIADMVPDCHVMADIGTDHGYLPIELVKTGKVTKAYAMDINKGPLLKASQNIVDQEVVNHVAIILSNGLEHLPEDVDVVVIAGMGGMLIGHILEVEKDKLRGVGSLILSPHLDEVGLRRKIHGLGWVIEAEKMVEDKGKFYTVMKCISGEECYTEIEYRYGKQLIDRHDSVWLLYLRDHVRKLKAIRVRLMDQITENTTKRLLEIAEEIEEVRMVTKNVVK